MADMRTVTREGVHDGESGRSNIFEGRTRELLPGIPDDITIARIAPKLPWKACQMLCLVSRAFQQAIQSRQIYDARVRAQSMEAFLLMSHKPVKDGWAIAMYSVSDGKCFNLPPIPGLKVGIPRSCQCISLECKLYVLGGSYESRQFRRPDQRSPRVYVLDLAGQRQWKQCAGMKDGRLDFACGVMNGKIYVFGGVHNCVCVYDPTTTKIYDFGGRHNCECVWESEVYDPKTNAWSRIAPLKNSSSADNHQTITMGDELFLHTQGPGLLWPGVPASAEVYHPVKDEWRCLEKFLGPRMCKEVPFLIGGKLHKLTLSSIYAYDVCKNSWELLQRYLCRMKGSSQALSRDVLAAVAVDGEIWATIGSWTVDVSHCIHMVEICLVRSQGFGCEDKKIEWTSTQCSLSFETDLHPFLYLVQL